MRPGSGPILAAAQLPGRGGDAAARLEQAEEALARAAAAGAHMTLFPEGFLPAYELRRVEDDSAYALAEGFLREASRAHDMVIGMGVMGRSGSALHLADPGGGYWRYTKRFPTMREARLWAPGPGPVIAETRLGRVGLMICADLLRRRSWQDLRGAVDLVAISAAWPIYTQPPEHVPRPIRRLTAGPFLQADDYRREVLIPMGARAVGAPVLFVNATGPFAGHASFGGGSSLYDADGVRVMEMGTAPDVQAFASPPPRSPRGQFRHSARWRAVLAVHRVGAKLKRSAPGHGPR